MNENRSTLSHPHYRADIDGLRAIAVLSVVFFHAFPSAIPGGFIGVDIFFVISGFLISTIIFQNLNEGTFSFATFYMRRIKRLFPSLLIVLTFCFALGWFSLLPDEYSQLSKHLAAGAVFLSNFAFWGEAGYFDNAADTKPLLHLWSLGIEEQFYLVWPLVMWVAWRQKLNLLTCALLALIISFVLNVYISSYSLVSAFYLPITRFWELIAGGILAWLIVYKNEVSTRLWGRAESCLNVIVYRDPPNKPVGLFPNLLSTAGVCLLAIGLWCMSKSFSFPGYWALVPVVSALLIIAGGANAWINRTILSNGILVWFGLISYPLYLWHWPILSFLRIVDSAVPSGYARFLAVIASVVLAYITYRL